MGGAASTPADQENFQSVFPMAAKVEEMLEKISSEDIQEVEQMSKEDKQKILALAEQIANALWEPRVLAGDKYTAAWALLRLDEQKILEATILELKIAMQKLQGMLADWLFDESNWTDVEGAGKSVIDTKSGKEFAASREPVMALFRAIRAKEAMAVMKLVQDLTTRVYSEISGSPTPIEISTVAGDTVYQMVPPLFEGRAGAAKFKFTEAPADIQQVYRDAALLLKGGFEPCGPGYDGGVQAVRDAEEDNKARYMIYLVAQGIVLQQRFHKAVAESVAGTANVEFRPAPHKKNARLVGKAKEYENEGVPRPAYRAMKDTVRCSVVCQDHASLVAAHAALLAVFPGKITKDRREEPSCRDVLQVVEFEGFLCEVQFHFAATLPLKVFSHAAYNVQRPEDIDLNGLKTIFKFPIMKMQTSSRDNVSCTLHF